MTRARQHLTIYQKNMLRDFRTANPSFSQEMLAEWAKTKFGVRVGRSTIGKIVGTAKEDYNHESAKRKQHGRFPDMEQTLFDFVVGVQDKATLSDMVLWAKANRILKASNSESTVSFAWVQRFKKRHGIQKYTLHGGAASVNAGALDGHRKELMDLLDMYSPADIFNMDETALFYRMAPSQTLATKSMSGHKKDKSRVTVGLCCNMDGSEKLAPIVINPSQHNSLFATDGRGYYHEFQADVQEALCAVGI
jgi:hypothetical protein